MDTTTDAATTGPASSGKPQPAADITSILSADSVQMVSDLSDFAAALTARSARLSGSLDRVLSAQKATPNRMEATNARQAEAAQIATTYSNLLTRIQAQTASTATQAAATGTVLDSSGNPVSGATVTLNDAAGAALGSQETNQFGDFEILATTVSEGMTLTVAVTADGKTTNSAPTPVALTLGFSTFYQLVIGISSA